MPGKNLQKVYLPDTYYHIYNRGINKEKIFLDDNDFAVFLNLIKRYLGQEVTYNKNKVYHPNYHSDIELLAFCLMKNHFHLYVYQKSDEQAITKFMRSLSTAYSMYFNKKYKRVGPVFQQRYRAVRIINDAQLMHVSRYIHLNPDNYNDYEWSSLPYYLSTKRADWISPRRILDLFDQTTDYKKFVDDYKEYRDDLEDLKHYLADNI
jgi:putative transposase